MIELRSGGVQAGFQLACMVISFVMAVAGGLLTGALIKFLFGHADERYQFLDKFSWEVPELEMPFFFDQRGEINRESMIAEVAHSVHGSNIWTARQHASGRVDPVDVEAGAGGALLPACARCRGSMLTMRRVRACIRGQEEEGGGGVV